MIDGFRDRVAGKLSAAKEPQLRDVNCRVVVIHTNIVYVVASFPCLMDGFRDRVAGSFRSASVWHLCVIQ